MITVVEKVTLTVQGMTCTGCEQRLGIALRRLDGVREAHADYRTGELTVRFDPGVTTSGAVIERVQTAGYDVEGSGGPAQ